MNIIRSNIIQPFKERPKVLFLVDSIGAFITAFLLFFVLRRFHESIGMSKAILTYLALIAACFCVYSTLCFFFLKQNRVPFIRGIGIANVLYCLLTIGLLIINRPFITLIGGSYFLVEISIITALAYIQLKTATSIGQIQKTG